MSFYGKAAALIVLGSLFVNQVLCQGGGCAVPEITNGPLADVNIYDELSSALLIFKGAHIPCSGYVFQWNFVSNVAVVNGVHFSLWRPISSAVENYQLIADIPIYGFQANRYEWNTYTHSPLLVQAGDIIGIFYDNAYTSQANVVVPYADEDSIGTYDPKLIPWYETPVAFLNASEIYNLRNITDLSASNREKRVPALQAIVSTENPFSTPFPPSPTAGPPPSYSYQQKCRASLTKDDFEKCEGYETMRYYYSQGTSTCLGFQGCPNVAASSNNFCTREACTRVCVQGLNVNPDTDCVLNRCAMDLEENRDFASSCYEDRYFFSKTTGKCMKFIGCDVADTRNNFDIMTDCQGQCEIA